MSPLRIALSLIGTLLLYVDVVRSFLFRSCISRFVTARSRPFQLNSSHSYYIYHVVAPKTRDRIPPTVQISHSSLRRCRCRTSVLTIIPMAALVPHVDTF